VDKELKRFSRHKKARGQPPYVTYAIPEGQDLPAFHL